MDSRSRSRQQEDVISRRAKSDSSPSVRELLHGCRGALDHGIWGEMKQEDICNQYWMNVRKLWWKRNMRQTPYASDTQVNSSEAKSASGLDSSQRSALTREKAQEDEGRRTTNEHNGAHWHPLTTAISVNPGLALFWHIVKRAKSQGCDPFFQRRHVSSSRMSTALSLNSTKSTHLLHDVDVNGKTKLPLPLYRQASV